MNAILPTLRTEDAPYVHNVRRVQIEQLSPFWRVVLAWQAMAGVNVERAKRCSIAAALEGLKVDCRMMETSFLCPTSR